MATYLGLQDDGLFYAAPNEEEFIEKYQEKWAEVMKDTYFQSEVVDVGHKLRPRLVFWGYLSNVSSLERHRLDDVAQVAVCVELVHKASLLLDDFIDKDTSRHSKPTFYVKYGAEKTIIYALNILSKSLGLLNQTYFKNNNLNSFYYRSMNDISLTLQDMTLGVLKELDLDINAITNAQEIQTIMRLETSSLITNSLLMGFYLTDTDNERVETTLKNVGNDLGYVFQILNDMESFFSTKLSEHKGSINNDINKSRKNICIPILFSIMSGHDKKMVYKSTTSINDKLLLPLLRRYNVKNILFDEIDNMVKKIKSEVFNIEFEYKNSSWAEDFFSFISSVVDVFKSRID